MNKNPHISSEELSLVSLNMRRNVSLGALQRVNGYYSFWGSPWGGREEEDFSFRLYLRETVDEFGERYNEKYGF